MKKISEVINITIKNIDDIYSQFNSKKLSDELGSYIYNQSLSINLKKQLVIKFCTDSAYSDEENNFIKRIVKQYFEGIINETKNYYKYNRIKKIFLFMLGIVLIFLSHFVNIKNEFIISEVLLIIGWVAIWEVFDNILLVESKKRFKIKKCKQLISSKILFNSDV